MNNYDFFFKMAHNNNLTNVQITEKTSIYNSANIINGRLISKENGNNKTYIVQADYNKKTIKANCNYLDERIIAVLIEKGRYENSKKIDILGDLSKNNKIDEEVEFNINEQIDENIKLKRFIKNNWALDTLVSYNYSKIRIINELGVDISSSNVINNFTASLIIRENGIVKTKYFDAIYGKDDKISYDRIVKELIDEAIKSITEIKIKSGKYKVLFKNNVMNVIIKKLPLCLNQRDIDDKISFLTDKLNEKIFSEKINIIEKPLDQNMPGYRTFDDEGVNTKNKKIIENGKLITYLCDNKTAKEDNINPTGNYYGDVSTRNMIIKCGNSSYDELIKDLDNGVIVYDIFSSFNSSPTDSTLSFQAYGLLVENGKIKGGLKSFIVTTTYFDLFNNVDKIGNDLLFNNIVCASPSIIVNNVDITI